MEINARVGLDANFDERRGAGRRACARPAPDGGRLCTDRRPGGRALICAAGDPPVRQRALPQSTGQEAPEGADKLFVTPSGLDVEGGLPALADETARNAAAFTDKRVSAADLFRAANELKIAYIRAGYS